MKKYVENVTYETTETGPFWTKGQTVVTVAKDNHDRMVTDREAQKKFGDKCLDIGKDDTDWYFWKASTDEATAHAIEQHEHKVIKTINKEKVLVDETYEYRLTYWTFRG